MRTSGLWYEWECQPVASHGLLQDGDRRGTVAVNMTSDFARVPHTVTDRKTDIQTDRKTHTPHRHPSYSHGITAKGRQAASLSSCASAVICARRARARPRNRHQREATRDRKSIATLLGKDTTHDRNEQIRKSDLQDSSGAPHSTHHAFGWAHARRQL